MANGDIVTAFYSVQPVTSEQHLITTRSSPLGDPIWSTKLDGSYRMRPNCLKITSDGSLLVAGYKQSILGANWNGFVMKQSAAGLLVWNKEVATPTHTKIFCIDENGTRLNLSRRKPKHQT